MNSFEQHQKCYHPSAIWKEVVPLGHCVYVCGDIPVSKQTSITVKAWHNVTHFNFNRMEFLFSLTQEEGVYNSTYSPHHRLHKTAMRRPHNYTLYNGTTPNIMGLIWPYNSPSLPIPALLQEGLKAPMSWDLSPGTISKYTQCTVTMYTHWEENGSKFSLTRGPGYRQVGHSHLSTEQPYNTSWLPTSLTNWPTQVQAIPRDQNHPGNIWMGRSAEWKWSAGLS